MKNILNVFFKEFRFALGILFYSSIMLNGLDLTQIKFHKIIAIWALYGMMNFGELATRTEDLGWMSKMRED